MKRKGMPHLRWIINNAAWSTATLFYVKVKSKALFFGDCRYFLLYVVVSWLVTPAGRHAPDCTFRGQQDAVVNNSNNSNQFELHENFHLPTITKSVNPLLYKCIGSRYSTIMVSSILPIFSFINRNTYLDQRVAKFSFVHVVLTALQHWRLGHRCSCGRKNHFQNLNLT